MCVLHTHYCVSVEAKGQHKRVSSLLHHVVRLDVNVCTLQAVWRTPSLWFILTDGAEVMTVVIPHFLCVVDMAFWVSVPSHSK